MRFSPAPMSPLPPFEAHKAIYGPFVFSIPQLEYQCHDASMPGRRKHLIATGIVAGAVALTSGCAAVALTAAGVGMGTAVSHTLGGIVYKTFAAPQGKVKRSTLAALGKMQIKVVDSKQEGNKDIIKARAADRDIEIEIEALTPNTTRLSVTATKDGGLIRDSATATEIILQSERLVGTG